MGAKEEIEALTRYDQEGDDVIVEDPDGEYLDRDEVLAIATRTDARITVLEEALRAQKNGLSNLLTMMKEYASIFLGNYQAVMAEAEADKDAKDLMKKHGFGKS